MSSQRKLTNSLQLGLLLGPAAIAADVANAAATATAAAIAADDDDHDDDVAAIGTYPTESGAPPSCF